MRWLLFLLLLLPLPAFAQSDSVAPGELSLSVTIDSHAETPVAREMILITIRGEYRRHITLEELAQPPLEGFNWTQLGEDHWTDERIDGRIARVFTRRMALYPSHAGELTIGAFTHKLTLTDAGDNWFAHDVKSEPVTISVAPAPVSDGWWFPVRSLQISDQWSNAPDQLAEGEGVLRIIRLEALGATPEMIPPMPELTSPSAMIYAHPEKRLMELTPQGPVTYAFWRWTIRPSNDTSGVVEPLRFNYFDTEARIEREVTISAQRIAYGSVTGRRSAGAGLGRVSEASLPGWPLALLAALVFAGGLAAAFRGWRFEGMRALERFSLFDPLARRMRRAARNADAAQLRRAARAIIRRDGASPAREKLLEAFDRDLFNPRSPGPDLTAFIRRFQKPG